MLTLENYVEKYLPLSQLKISFDLIKFTVEDPSNLVKQQEKMYSEIADKIMRDNGEGSIYKSILEINEYCSERLSLKMDLT